MANIEPTKGPERALDFTGRTYYREHLPASANEGDRCSLAESGGSGWHNTRYVYQDGGWVFVSNDRPWQMDAWNIGGRPY